MLTLPTLGDARPNNLPATRHSPCHRHDDAIPSATHATNCSRALPRSTLYSTIIASLIGKWWVVPPSTFFYESLTHIILSANDATFDFPSSRFSSPRLRSTTIRLLVRENRQVGRLIYVAKTGPLAFDHLSARFPWTMPYLNAFGALPAQRRLSTSILPASPSCPSYPASVVLSTNSAITKSVQWLPVSNPKMRLLESIASF